MKGFVFISAVIIHCSWSYASPGPESSRAFAYVDTSGNRVKRFLPIPSLRPFRPLSPSIRMFPPLPPLPPLRPFRPFKLWPPLPPLRPFQPFKLWPPLPPLRPFHPFKPLRPLPPLRPFPHRDIFGNIENQQRAAFDAAQSAFNGFNAFPYIPNFDFRFPSFQSNYGMSSSNSAYAAGAVGPGYRRQVASIDPANPMMPNVDTRFIATNPLGNGKDFYSVSSSSYSSSVNDNGRVQSQRGAETVVNDRGQVTRYSVHS